MTPTISDYLHILRRRKWIVVVLAIVVPTGAVAVSLKQAKRYQASSQVLINRTSFAAALSGTADPNASQDATLIIQTQVDIARTPPIITRVLAITRGSGLNPDSFLTNSTVQAEPNSDLLTFTVTAKSTTLAKALATQYGVQFIRYRRQLDTVALSRALHSVEASIHRIHRDPTRRVFLASLQQKRSQIQTLLALQTSNAFLVKTPDKAPQTAPKPTRDGLLGLGIGILVALGIVALLETLDPRVRSTEEVAEALELPLLGRLARPPRRASKRGGVPWLLAPGKAEADAIGLLSTNLEFARLQQRAQVIMVTSAGRAEGKSTTVASLAMALARDGSRVVLVDLDLRNPALGRLLGVDPAAEANHASADPANPTRALVDVPTFPAVTTPPKDPSSLKAGGRGALQLLPMKAFGLRPESLSSNDTVAAVLHELRNHADLVLIDSPPMLRFRDALTVSRFVDALVVVVRMTRVGRSAVSDLARLLAASPAIKLGFVATDTHGRDTSSYMRGRYGPRPAAEPTTVDQPAP